MRYGSCPRDTPFTNGIDRNYCCIMPYKGNDLSTIVQTCAKRYIMKKKNHWLVLCVFLFPQLLWALEDQSDIAYDQLNIASLSKQSRLQAIRDFIRVHPKYAQAHYDLHKVLIEDHTPEAYQIVRCGITRALRWHFAVRMAPRAGCSILFLA